MHILTKPIHLSRDNCGALPSWIGSLDHANSALLAELVSTFEEFLVIEARPLLGDKLWVPSCYMAHGEPALLATLIDEAPSLLSLLTTDLLHLRITAEARRDRRDNPLRITIGRFFLVRVLNNRSHVVLHSCRIYSCPCKIYKQISVCFPRWLR